MLKLDYLLFQIQLGFLGSGSYARVQKAIFNNEEVAVKIFTKVYDKKSEAEFLREVFLFIPTSTFITSLIL